MALFRIQVDVDSFLQLDAGQRDQFRRLVQAEESIAASLVAIVTKMNEPDPEDPQPAIDALVAKLAASNTTLADEVAKILTPNQGA